MPSDGKDAIIGSNSFEKQQRKLVQLLSKTSYVVKNREALRNHEATLMELSKNLLKFYSIAVGGLQTAKFLLNLC